MTAHSGEPFPDWLTADQAIFDAHYPTGARSPRVGALNRVLVRALRGTLDAVPGDHELEHRPLTLSLCLPLATELRFYIYKATQHQSERQVGTFRVQLTTGGDFIEDGRRFRFRRADSIRPVLVGYDPGLHMFIVWDADVHDAGAGFPYSKGVQAPPELVYGALASGLQTAERHVRSVGLTEKIVAARPEKLACALLSRIELSNERLFMGPHAE